MTTLAIEMPEEVLSSLQSTPQEFARQMRLASAIHWYAKGKISQEKAAQIAGLDQSDFLEEVQRESRAVIKPKHNETEEERQAAISQAIAELVASDVASRFGDPMEWQREVRKDRPLPGRD